VDAMTFYERAVAVERSWRLVPERCYACGRVFPSVAARLPPVVQAGRPCEPPPRLCLTTATVPCRMIPVDGPTDAYLVWRGLMHTEPKPPHGSAEWLAVRHRDPQGRARLTASVAGVLFDCHPFITPAELATQMLAETPPEASWSEAIERGT
jgi:hypothetical protein